LLGNLVDFLVVEEPLGRLLVVLLEFLNQIRADIAVHFLNTLGNFEGLSRRDRLAAVTQKVLNESADISTGQRNVLNAGADNVTFSLSIGKLVRLQSNNNEPNFRERYDKN
jgi:hypothetical protein